MKIFISIKIMWVIIVNAIIVISPPETPKNLKKIIRKSDVDRMILISKNFWNGFILIKIINNKTDKAELHSLLTIYF